MSAAGLLRRMTHPRQTKSAGAKSSGTKRYPSSCKTAGKNWPLTQVSATT